MRWRVVPFKNTRKKRKGGGRREEGEGQKKREDQSYSSSNWEAVIRSVCVCESFSHVRLSVTPWTVAVQAPLSTGFSRQEDWTGLQFPSSGTFSTQGLNPGLARRLFSTWATREARWCAGTCPKWALQGVLCGSAKPCFTLFASFHDGTNLFQAANVRLQDTEWGSWKLAWVVNYVFRLRKGLVQWPLVKPVNLPRFVSQVEISPCIRVSQPWHCWHFRLDHSQPSVRRCLAAFLATPYRIPAVPSPHPAAAARTLSGQCQVSLWRQNCSRLRIADLFQQFNLFQFFKFAAILWIILVPSPHLTLMAFLLLLTLPRVEMTSWLVGQTWLIIHSSCWWWWWWWLLCSVAWFWFPVWDITGGAICMSVTCLLPAAVSLLFLLIHPQRIRHYSFFSFNQTRE